MMDILRTEVGLYADSNFYSKLGGYLGYTIWFTVENLVEVDLTYSRMSNCIDITINEIANKENKSTVKLVNAYSGKIVETAVTNFIDNLSANDEPSRDHVSLADLNHGYLSTQAIPKAEKYGTFEFCITLNNRSDVKCKIVYNQSKAYSLRLADYDTEFDKIIDISVSSKYSLLTIENLFMFLIKRYIFRDYGLVKLSLGSDHTYYKCSMDEDKPDYEQKYWDCQRRIDDYERNLNGYKEQIEKKSKIIQNLLHTTDTLTDANDNLKKKHKELDEAYTACLERIDELQKENDNLRKANEDFDNANERLKNKLNMVRDERYRYEQLVKDIRVGLSEVKGLFHDIDRSPYNRILVAESKLDQLTSRIKLHICCCSHPDELSED